MKKKTHEEYVAELAIKNPNIEVIGKYVNAKTSILHKCLIDGYEWFIKPNNALSGIGCPKCAGNIKKTHEEYVEEVSLVNPHIEVVGRYVDAKTSILHKCLIDGYEWYAKPNNILNGKGCPKCAGTMKKSHEEYVLELATLNPNIEPIEWYISANTPILHRCKIHGIEWRITPSDALQGNGCYECGNEKIADKNGKTHNEYVADLKETNPDIHVIGTYINSNTPILHECLVDGYKWYAKPSNILYGLCGCPQCNESHGERLIRQWLVKNNVSYEYQKSFCDCRDIRVLPFDFYLPDYNACIEYDGEQHYRSVDHFGGEEYFEKVIKHDTIKTEYCVNNSIKLLRIPYYADVDEELNNFLFI